MLTYQPGASGWRERLGHGRGEAHLHTIVVMMLQGHLGVEAHGPLGTLWVSLGLIGFYIGLIWINSLLGMFLTPLMVIPQTWLMDFMKRRRGKSETHTAE